MPPLLWPATVGRASAKKCALPTEPVDGACVHVRFQKPGGGAAVLALPVGGGVHANNTGVSAKPKPRAKTDRQRNIPLPLPKAREIIRMRRANAQSWRGT
ncbi:hypothetical protein IMZ48_06230 [Candidatus Bathyarchaeota archaeon]|nr:hypothetical protein [Candidatus Bathyarchaeota archaeon]